jgi:site-specific recombinase XerD
VKLGRQATDALADLPAVFWSGQSISATAIGNMRRTIDRLCTNADVAGNPHRFRDTFAVRLLEKGVSIDQVSILHGHQSVLRAMGADTCGHDSGFWTRL